ncbi:MAG TPA: hypothetical protein VGL19_10125 [Polyangiaceae bacterium]|jgi:hypothetical protein
MSQQAANATSLTAEQRDANLGLALLVSVLAVLVLAAVAFWPTRSWAPPRRPGISPPVVFDEFVNAPNSSPPASSSAPGPGLN